MNRVYGDAAINAALGSSILDMKFDDDDPMILCAEGVLTMWGSKKFLAAKGVRISMSDGNPDGRLLDGVAIGSGNNGRWTCLIKHGRGTLSLTWKRGPIRFMWTPLSESHWATASAIAGRTTT